MTKEKQPHNAKPINIGRAVVFTKLPMKVPNGTEKSVAMNPVMAAPIPAIWPIGCIINARRFPKTNPIQKNCIPKKASRISIEGFTAL